MSDECPQDDRALAKSRGHAFSVATKDKRGGRWTHVQCGILDLAEALTLARRLHAYEAGIFVQGGFLYWTSVHPDVFNSTVIKMRISRGEAQD